MIIPHPSVNAILLAQRNSFPKDRYMKEHTHDFWQYEHVRNGTVRMTADGTEYRLTSDKPVLIAPGVTHSLRYTAAHTEFISVKFAMVPLSVPRCIALGKPFIALAASVNELVPKHANISEPERQALLHIMSAICIIAVPGSSSERSHPAVASVKKLIDERILTRQSIASLAEHLGYTPNYLTGIFHRHEGISLKQYCIARTCSAIQEHLVFTDRRLGDIARQFGFPDIYSFSRFFKTGTGMSPREFRNSRQIRSTAD
ncbi:MAG: helix-turn-helix transcriptional regulator [Spirochaetes bacterium]|nr:helix-turn-helix transcriptional regulator [Spirochaetota bacterium]